MNNLKKFWPLLVSVLAVVGPAVSPAVQAFYAKHPEGLALFLSAWGAFKFLLPSPLAK